MAAFSFLFIRIDRLIKSFLFNQRTVDGSDLDGKFRLGFVLQFHGKFIARRGIHSLAASRSVRLFRSRQGETGGILQGSFLRADIEIGGLVAIVVLIEGEGATRRVGGVQGDGVVREVLLYIITKDYTNRCIGQGTLNLYIGWLYRFYLKFLFAGHTYLPQLLLARSASPSVQLSAVAI